MQVRKRGRVEYVVLFNRLSEEEEITANRNKACFSITKKSSCAFITHSSSAKFIDHGIELFE